MARQEGTRPKARSRGSGLTIHQRIRNRRQERGLAGYELARRVGISPSYISLIEKGTKVPSEEIAEKIARVLDDDPDLYRAWAHSTRVGDLEDTLTGVVRLMEISSDPRLRKLFSSGDDIDTLDGVGEPEAAATEPGLRRGLERVRKLFGGRRAAEPAPATSEQPAAAAEPTHLAEACASYPESADPTPTPSTALSLEDIERALADSGSPAAAPVVEVTVLVEGTDPDTAGRDGTRVPDTLMLDRRTLPGDEAGELFAYRIADGGFSGVRGQLAPGDLLVLARDVGVLSPERVYAVRSGKRVVLSRVMLKDRSLLLLPREGESRFEVVEVDDPQRLEDVIVGRVLLTMKRW